MRARSIIKFVLAGGAQKKILHSALIDRQYILSKIFTALILTSIKNIALILLKIAPYNNLINEMMINGGNKLNKKWATATIVTAIRTIRSRSMTIM